ncbi:MAG TPA: hypothetical protein DDZ62_07750 [Delftia acidovorans]|nr:hypothetical protein [Delftia acidovorans]
MAAARDEIEPEALALRRLGVKAYAHIALKAVGFIAVQSLMQARGQHQVDPGIGHLHQTAVDPGLHLAVEGHDDLQALEHRRADLHRLLRHAAAGRQAQLVVESGIPLEHVANL